MRLQQFHASSPDPEDYWNEALRRDPSDSRVNAAMGITRLKQARYPEAEAFLRKALERPTDRFTTPRDAEPLYYLALTLKAEGKFDEAYKNFYLATWNLPWRAAGYYGLAEIATRRGNLTAALDFVNRSLNNNELNIRAVNLKASILRHMGKKQEAIQVLAATHRIDPLDVRTMAERWLASGAPDSRTELTAVMTQFPATAEETAAEYLNAGLWSDGAEILSEAIAAAPDATKIQPMLYYYRGYFDEKLNQPKKAAEDYALAAKMPSDYVFPFQNEAIDVLHTAMKANPKDAQAPYYLGNLLFDSQPDEAIALWQASAALDPSNAIVHRNLGVAWSHHKSGNSMGKAIAQMELAVSLPHKYALHFTELDEMYEAEGVAPEKRLALLEDNSGVVAQRDDSLAREINLLVATGKFDQAITLLNSKEFAVWEGGTLSVADDWAEAHLLRGRLRLQDGQAKDAIDDFKAALEVPSNLPSEQRIDREPEADYYLGKAYQALGDQDQAKQYWQKSSTPEKASPAHSDHDGIGPRAIQAAYQAFSLRALEQNDQANAAFHALLDRANRITQKQPAQFDLNAPVSDLLAQRSRFAIAHYVAAMSYLGLDDKQKEIQELNLALQAMPGLAAP